MPSQVEVALFISRSHRIHSKHYAFQYHHSLLVTTATSVNAEALWGLAARQLLGATVTVTVTNLLSSSCSINPASTLTVTRTNSPNPSTCPISTISACPMTTGPTTSSICNNTITSRKTITQTELLYPAEEPSEIDTSGCPDTGSDTYNSTYNTYRIEYFSYIAGPIVDPSLAINLFSDLLHDGQTEEFVFQCSNLCDSLSSAGLTCVAAVYNDATRIYYPMAPGGQFKPDPTYDFVTALLVGSNTKRGLEEFGVEEDLVLEE